MVSPQRTHAEVSRPSAWVERHAHLIASGSTVLDLASGGGRHTRLLLERGHRVVAIDRDTTGLRDLRDNDRLEVIEADLESGSDWPLEGRQFGGLLVVNYLHRPLLPRLPGMLEPGGVLIYETFAQGNERFGKPRNPDFLLAAGELLDVYASRLSIVAFEQGQVDVPAPAVIQRRAAIRQDPISGSPALPGGWSI